MSQAGYFQFARPYAHAGGTISGVRAFAPAAQNAFAGFFNSTTELPREWIDTLRQLHPDIRGPLSSALQTLKNQNVEVQLSPVRATANDILAADRLAFSAAGSTPEANAAITKALTDQGLVAGRSTGRFQSNPDSEVPAIAALPSIRGRDGLSYRVIPGGTVWERSAGAPQFAQAVQTQLAERFGNTQATPGRAIALSAPPENTTTTSPSPQGQQQLADPVANATDRFQQSRGHTMSTGQQRTTPAATPAAPQRQPQTVAPFVGNITQTGLDDPRVKNTIDRLQAWNQSLPEGRRNDALASADMNQPENRLNLLMHFKRDQNAHAGGRYALNDASRNPLVGNDVNTALAAFAAAQPTPAAAPQAPAQSTAPQPPASAATPPAAGTAPAARPAAPAATPPAAAIPVPPVRPSRPSDDGLVAKLPNNSTPEQRAERHTENGLRVLGITNGNMSPEERAAALKQYAAGAGLPEGATPAQIREQVGKDIRALQERLRDANNADATKGRYDLGRFGQNGVDGIAGAYTQGALQRYIQDNPGQTALGLIGRPNNAVATPPAQGTTPPSPPAATPPAAPSATTPVTPAPSAASTTTPATPPAGTTPPAAPSAAVTPSATPAPEPTEAQRQSAQFTIDAARIPILRGNPLFDLQQRPPIDPASIITGPTGPSMEERLRAARAAAGPSHEEVLRTFNLAPTPAPAPSAATPAPADGVTREGIQDALRIPPEHRSQAPAPSAAPIRTDALPPDVLNQAAAATSGSQRFDVAQADTIGASNARNGKPHQPDKSTAIG